VHRLFLFALTVAILPNAFAFGAISFTRGHYYSSTDGSSVITEYNAAGLAVGSLNVGRDVRGITFGPDGLLYATTTPQLFGFEVIALDESGFVHATYPASTYINGNISYGKIAVSDSNIYVAGGNVLTKFDVGSPNSAAVIHTNNQVYDVEILPSGNLLVASAYDVQELTPGGNLVRYIEPPGSLYTDIRGVEFDPATNNMFVTHLGHTGFFFQIMRIDWLTGALEESVEFHYADDLFVTLEGDLLVGSRTQTPRLYSQELDQLGGLSGPAQLFVTQYTLPEPSAAAMVVVAATLLARRIGRNRPNRNWERKLAATLVLPQRLEV
jgi:hypothetical protein